MAAVIDQTVLVSSYFMVGYCIVVPSPTQVRTWHIASELLLIWSVFVPEMQFPRTG